MYRFHKNFLTLRNLRAISRYKSGSSDLTRNFKPGSQVYGYTVKEVTEVPELYITAVRLTHDKTGADHLHIAKDDTNNVFGVAFRTTPMDDTGVPHILEHTALCGSKRYPVRDPFFKMLNRSLSTFMNAFTASDWTMYPFSTQNEQDYKNLLSVYLDAAFFPRLSEMDFMQEGWRLEHENNQDKSSPIVFKGVVFNEMKGVFSNSQNVFAQKVQNELMPNHTYSKVSGGDPLAIPELTWEHLKQFHASHYHPSNARFYTYGSFPLERTLEQIDSDVLSQFDKIDPGTEVPSEPRWTKPRRVNITCPPDPMAPDQEKQTTVAVNFLLCDVTDTFEANVMSALSNLLVSGEKSPFYQALLEANIGSDFAPTHGYDPNQKDAYFAIGLQGIKKEDVDKVENIINETIDDVIENGFPQERIDALLHKIELSQKHQTVHFGLNVGVSLVSSWNHDGNPVRSLEVNKFVEKFKQSMKENPKFLQEKMKQYYKENNHKLTVVMNPDDKYDAMIKEKEAKKLKEMVEKLSEQEKETIYQKGLELATLQNKKEDLSCLPTLKVSDVSKDVARHGFEKIMTSDNIPIQLNKQPTNGMTYFRAVSSTADLPENLQPYIPLFCSVLTKMGAGELDYKELSQQMDLYTGGMSACEHTSEHHTQENNFEQGILLSSFCLDKNTDNMFRLWTEIFNRLDMSDSGRLTTLVMMSAAEMANSLAGAGHMYAMRHSASSLTGAAAYKEVMSGMSQVKLMKSIAESQDITGTLQKLTEIASHLLNKSKMRCSLNCTDDFSESAVNQTSSFISSLPGSSTQNPEFYYNNSTFVEKKVCTQFELPFQVNYMGRSVKTVPYTHEDFGSLRVLAKLLTSKFLHREIREKGGAYGGGSMASTGSLFNFFSYRDPNSTRTLEMFDKSIDWCLEGSFTQQDIDESKLAIFQQVDMPVAPGDRGMTHFMHGRSDDLRQQHKQHLFTVNKESLVDVTERYLAQSNRVSSDSFLGPENEAIKSTNIWNIIHA